MAKLKFENKIPQLSPRQPSEMLSRPMLYKTKEVDNRQMLHIKIRTIKFIAFKL